jgi:hypothetical protein
MSASEPENTTPDLVIWNIVFTYFGPGSLAPINQ